MSPAMVSIIIVLFVCVYAVTTTDLVLKEGDYYNFTCASNEDYWYVTKSEVHTLAAVCWEHGQCHSLDYKLRVKAGFLVNGGTFFYLAVYRNMTKVSCSISDQNWSLIITDLMDIRVSSFTLAGQSNIFLSAVTVDVGNVLTFRCFGSGPPDTPVTISTNRSMVSVLSCEHLKISPSIKAECSMWVNQCGVLFDVYCQAGYDVTTRKTIRVSSSKCLNLNQDLTDIKVEAFTLLGETVPLPSVVTVDVGRTLEFQCTGHGPPGTTFTISNNIPRADVTPPVRVNEGETTVDVNYVMRVKKCGVLFEVNCQALDHVTTKKTIRVSSSDCPTQPTSYYTTVPTFKPDFIGDSDSSDRFSFTANMATETLEVHPGSDVTFACSGSGAEGTKLYIYNATSQKVLFSYYVPELTYTLQYWECGSSSVIGCQMGDDATSTREITVTVTKCSGSGPPSSNNSSKLIWPLTASGIIFALGATGVYLAYRVQLVKRRAARNAVSHGSETTGTSTTSLDPPPPYVNVSYTNASLEPPYIAAAVSGHGSLPPRYSVVVRDAGQYKMTSAASLFDRPPLYESLFGQAATQK